MHLAFVTTFYYPRMRGGAEHSLKYHAESLVQQGLRVSVISLHEGTEPDRFVHQGVECHALPAPNLAECLNPRQTARPLARALWHVLDIYNAAGGRLLERELRAIQPDLVQTENLPGWSCAAWGAAARWGRPHVQMLHDYQLACPRATRFHEGRNCTGTCASCLPFSLVHRRLSQRVRHVVANSEYTRNLFRGFGFFRQSRSFDVMYGAVPATRAIARPAGPPQLRVGYLGRLHATKGIALLIDAFAAAGRPDAVLRIAGTGTDEYEHELRARAGRGAVTFLGQVPATEFLSSIDLLVVPSLWNEPMGRVVIEAAGQGVPVLAAARGGIPELFEEGVTGWAFDPDQPAALADKLRTLDVATVRAMRGDCLRLAEKYAPEPVARRWLELYTRLVSEYRQSTTAGASTWRGQPTGVETAEAPR